MNPLVLQLRQQAIHEEFDYSFLMSCLADYQQPRDKISRMIKNGDIIRVKKGLYVFGPAYQKAAYSKEVLANLIYGPSYISLEYALSFYNLIPERVVTVTSITNKRNKAFQTPIGLFTYQYLKQEKYAVGITIIQTDPTHHFLMATKEKALVDILWFKNQTDWKSKDEAMLFLQQDLRIEMADIKKLKRTRLQEIAKAYQFTSIDFLLDLIKGGRHA